MKIRAAHLMSEADLAVWLSVPRFEGHIIDPRYLDRSIARDRYIASLGAWCRANSKAVWPDWLTDFATWMKHERSSGRRHTATPDAINEDGSERAPERADLAA